jgi:hypothetical protein
MVHDRDTMHNIHRDQPLRPPKPSNLQFLHLGNGSLDLELTKEGSLLGLGLESTVTEGGGSRDVLES